MADFLVTLRERQKEYRTLLRNLLKKVRKFRRRLEKQQREKAMRTGEPVEKANEGRASNSSANIPLFTAALETFRLAMLGRPSCKGDRRRRRQAREKANAERLQNQNPAVEQMEEADREEGEGPPSDSFEQLCDQIQEQLGPQEQRIVRVVEVPEEVVSVPAVFTVDDDTLVITVEDVDMM